MGYYICIMKKIAFILFTLVFVPTLIGQTFYRYSLPYVNNKIDSCLDAYSHEGSKDLVRHITLDSCARSRADYYLDVIETNSRYGKSFSNMLDSISYGHAAHTELFGNSRYFKKPQTTYPVPFKNIKSIGVRTKGEIMQEITWSKTYPQKQKPNEVVKDAVEAINDPIHEHIVNGYKESKSHNDIIKKWGDGKFGTSTRVLVSEKKEGNAWTYEIMIYNVAVFSTPNQ